MGRAQAPRQQETVADVVAALVNWARARPDFVVGTNEAGMRLGDDTRAADAAAWRRADTRRGDPGLRFVPPVLAVEVTGREEGEQQLRDKARWYLRVGVPVVWLVLPEVREVVVITGAGATRHRIGERLPADPRLPDLARAVDEFFVQVSGAGPA